MPNHLLELTAGLSVLAAVGLERLRRAPTEDEARPCSAPRGVERVKTAATFALLIGTAAYALMPARILLASAVAEDPAALVNAIRQAPGEVLTEQDSLAVVRAGKTPVAADPYALAMLALKQRWDPAPLNTMIETKAFSLIVLTGPAGAISVDGYPWWPSGTEERIQRHYRLVGQIGSRYLYEPSAS